MNKTKNRIKNILKDCSGMGVVEIILIILVLVGLAFVFKNQIFSIANSIYSSIKTEVNAF